MTLSTTMFDENNLVNFGPLTRKMTLTFTSNRIRAVVEIHVHAKYHQAVCSGSWIIVLTEKKNLATTLPIAAARTIMKSKTKAATLLKVEYLCLRSTIITPRHRSSAVCRWRRWWWIPMEIWWEIWHPFHWITTGIVSRMLDIGYDHFIKGVSWWEAVYTVVTRNILLALLLLQFVCVSDRQIVGQCRWRPLNGIGQLSRMIRKRCWRWIHGISIGGIGGPWLPMPVLSVLWQGTEGCAMMLVSVWGPLITASCTNLICHATVTATCPPSISHGIACIVKTHYLQLICCINSSHYNLYLVYCWRFLLPSLERPSTRILPASEKCYNYHV